MNLNKLLVRAFVGFCCFVSSVSAAELEKMDAEVAKQYGKIISELFAKDLKGAAVTFEVDPEKTTGLHADHEGIMMVPMKGMKEGEVNPDVEKENGGGLCYLFLSPSYKPHADGAPIDKSKLLSVEFQDEEGNRHEALAMIITVKHEGGDDWRLYAFGKEKTPLIKSPFGLATGSGKGIVDIGVDTPKDGKANLTFTLVGMYSAAFPISVK